MYATDFYDVRRQRPSRFGDEVSVGENHRRFYQFHCVVRPRGVNFVLAFSVPYEHRTVYCQYRVGKTLGERFGNASVGQQVAGGCRV